MNRSEERAFRWLVSNFKLNPKEIEYEGDVPSLRTKDGRGFAVKKVYGGKTAVFYPGEFEKIIDEPNKNTLLLFNDKDSEPMKQIPARVLLENRDRYEDLKFVHIEKEKVGPQGEIIIKVTRRNFESRYYRAGHIPVESLLVWPRGDYEFVKSIDGSGKLGFYIVMKPMAF